MADHLSFHCKKKLENNFFLPLVSFSSQQKKNQFTFQHKHYTFRFMSGKEELFDEIYDEFGKLFQQYYRFIRNTSMVRVLKGN